MMVYTMVNRKLNQAEVQNFSDSAATENATLAVYGSSTDAISSDNGFQGAMQAYPSICNHADKRLVAPDGVIKVRLTRTRRCAVAMG